MMYHTSVLIGVTVVTLLATVSLSCPPGFVPKGNSCVCADWPDEMVICDEDPLNYSALMQTGYCMTFDNETGEVRAGACVQTVFRIGYHKLFYYRLPAEVSDLNDKVCGPSNTIGLLCGKCQDGFAVSPLRNSINCINCTSISSGWSKFLATTYLPLTVVFTVMIIFGTNIVSGPINSFIFFAQVTSAELLSISFRVRILEAHYTSNYSHRSPMTVFTALYEVWNLDFFRSFVSPFCLTNHLTRLQEHGLEYFIAFYPLILVTFLYICIKLYDYNFRPIVYCWKPFLKCFLRLRRRVNPKTSLINTFATFILLSYVKCLFVAMTFLTPQPIYNGQGQKLSTSVMAFSTSTQFFHSEHLPLAILSIFVLLTIIAIPPIVLILYSFSTIQKCLTQCKMNYQGLRTFVETFQGCYKDGTNGTRDCRCFAGLYFILRIVVVIVCVASDSYFLYTFAFILIYGFTALVFALVRPYKRGMYNVIDAVMFGVLGTIYTLIAYNFTHALFFRHLSTSLLVLINVLYALPLLYFVLFIVHLVLDRKTNCIQKLKSTQLLRNLFQGQSEPENFGAAIPHRLQNPEQYETLSYESQVDYEETLKDVSSRTYGTI